MGVIKKKLLFLPLLLSLLLAATSAADYFAGMPAWHQFGDCKTSLKEFGKLARHGHTEAQYNLGLMYEEGWCVPQDYVLAHMWINIAASRMAGEEQKAYSKARDRVAKKMTPSQIAEAQKLAREWKPKKE